MVVQLQRWFFELPAEVKERARRTEGNSRGWYNDGFTKQKVDWKESFDFGVEGRPQDDIDGSNRWLGWQAVCPPQHRAQCDEFRSKMLEYFDNMTELSAFLAQVLAVAAGLPPTHFSADFERHTSYIGLNYYPRCQDTSRHLGVNPHKDAGLLTVLAQHDVAGLQVYTGQSDGLERDDPCWVPVEPLPGALLVNIGDMMQVVSNGRFRAPLHRVLANARATRMSAPFFYNPGHDCTFHPAGCGAGELPVYRPINWGDFRRRRLAGDMRDLGREAQIDDYLL